MKDRVESLRRKYKIFRKDSENVLAVRSDALLVLEAMRKGNREIVEEVEDMVVGLEFLIEENKCYRQCSSC